MTYNPKTLQQLGAYWVTHNGVNLGVVGNTAHTRGYHLGRDRIYDGSGPGVGDNDYSVKLSRDKAGLTNAASAIDLGRLEGQLTKLYAFSRWLVAEAREDRTKYRDIREVIYSPDGKTVQRYSGVDNAIHTGPGNGDLSHLTHTHISFFRDSETRDKLPLFAGYFALPPDTSTEEPVRNFTLLYGSDGRTITGTVTFPDDPAARYLNLSAGTLHKINPAWVKQAVKVRLTEPMVAGKPDTDDWTLGWLIGDDAAFVLDRNATFAAYEPKPLPYSVKLSLTVGGKPVSVTTGPLTLP